MLEHVFQHANEFDLIHFHCDYLHFPLSRRHSTVGITTLHGRLDLPDLVPLYREFCELPLISISNAQRKPLPWANWISTVYHGLPHDLHQLYPNQGRYLAFLGRISPEKGAHCAIQIAKKTGIELHMAAKVDRVDEEYFKSVVEPLLDDPLIQYVGEIGEDKKDEFLGNALALLVPGDWPEPFGLVMIEAMACGTPVIGLGRGSVPEVIEHGESGFVINNLEEAVTAVNNIYRLRRRTCREIFDRRFTAGRMAHDYLASYDQALAHSR
jgi:glycosyltransferase involved in cell wall biosynthesis